MPQASATGHSQTVLALRQDDSGYAGQMEELSDILYPTFVYRCVLRCLPDNPASVLETDKSGSLMMSKLVKEMYSKMLMREALNTDQMSHFHLKLCETRKTVGME